MVRPLCCDRFRGQVCDDPLDARMTIPWMNVSPLHSASVVKN